MENKNVDRDLIQEFEQLNIKLATEQIDTEIELENAMGLASEQMERDEIFSKLKYYSHAYRAGFNEGFLVGRQLMQKHDTLKAESIYRKYLELKDSTSKLLVNQ